MSVCPVNDFMRHLVAVSWPKVSARSLMVSHCSVYNNIKAPSIRFKYVTPIRPTHTRIKCAMVFAFQFINPVIHVFIAPEFYRRKNKETFSEFIIYMNK